MNCCLHPHGCHLDQPDQRCDAYPTRLSKHRLPKQSRQVSGYVLILILVFLLITAIIGSATFFGSFSESKKSFNFTNSSLTFQNAESALRTGENFLLAAKERPEIVAPGTTVPSGFAIYDPLSLAAEVVEPGRRWPEETMPWWRTFGQSTATTITALPDPIVIIEEVGFQPDSAAVPGNYGTGRPGVVYYQVSVRSTGLASSSATLQSILAARYN